MSINPGITTAVVKPAVKDYFNRALLLRVIPYLSTQHFAWKFTLPMNSGDTLITRRYNTLTPSVVPLTEGDPGTAASATVSDIKIPIKFYGAWTKITDVVQYTVQENVMNEFSFSFAQQMGVSLDALYYGIMNTTASIVYCSGGVTTPSAATPGSLTESDIQTAVIGLRSANGRMLSVNIEGRDGYSTFPIRNAYWGMMHTDLTEDLEKSPHFVSVANYANQASILPGIEWGSVKNTRWTTSTNALKITTGNLAPSGTGGAMSATASDPHYGAFLVAEQGFGGVHLGREMGSMIVKPLGSGGTSDPLNMISSVGWKMSWGGAVLNDSWVIKLICRDSKNFVAVP